MSDRLTKSNWFWFVVSTGVISTLFWILGIILALVLGYYDDPNPWSWYVVTGLLWLGACLIGFCLVGLIVVIVRD